MPLSVSFLRSSGPTDHASDAATLAQTEIMDSDLLKLGDRVDVHSLLANTNSTAVSANTPSPVLIVEQADSPCMKLEGGARIACEDKEEEEAKKAWKDGWTNSGGDHNDVPPASRDCAGCEEKL